MEIFRKASDQPQSSPGHLRPSPVGKWSNLARSALLGVVIAVTGCNDKLRDIEEDPVKDVNRTEIGAQEAIKRTLSLIAEAEDAANKCTELFRDPRANIQSTSDSRTIKNVVSVPFREGMRDWCVIQDTRVPGSKVGDQNYRDVLVWEKARQKGHEWDGWTITKGAVGWNDGLKETQPNTAQEVNFASLSRDIQPSDESRFYRSRNAVRIERPIDPSRRVTFDRVSGNDRVGQSLIDGEYTYANLDPINGSDIRKRIFQILNGIKIKGSK